MKTNNDSLPIVPAAQQAAVPAPSMQPGHPLGTKARVLLTSVFGPYGADDEYGSRSMNPMELYHNQVTRVQGPFSLRMFHRSWGLMLIQSNISAPCTLLDFPTRDRFLEEITTQQYDIIGISSIIPNRKKVRHMVELIRKHQPQATIVIGGHIANVPGLKEEMGADHVIRGEGVAWFRRFLGEDADRTIRHPRIVSGLGTRNVGVTVKDQPGDVAATVIPSVGCPLGCNFCSTSAMFGGKGKSVNFYQTGDELFDIMSQMEATMHVRSFFVMDENFLLHRPRALRLLELMREHNKAWAFYVFSSANALKTYTIEQLVALGVSWVWMGLEGENSRYSKLHGTDSRQLIRTLQSHGIRVLGSSIIGLENHTPENIDEAIDFSVAHDTDFHQFMLYTPIPGTPLYAELEAQGVMKDPSEFEEGDVHGQLIFNYRHPHIPAGAEGEMMVRAFTRDFEVNGPSVARIVRTTLAGWRRYKNHPDARIRDRFAWEARELGSTFSAVVSGAKLYFKKKSPALFAKLAALESELHREFGWKSRFYSLVGGRFVLAKIRAEEKRLAAGWTYEPPTYYECNQAARAAGVDAAKLCEPLTCRVAPPAAAAAATSAPPARKPKPRGTLVRS